MRIVSKIGIIGGGSWATALAKVLQNKSKKINWWFRRKEAIEFLKIYKHNPDYLSSVEFNTDLLFLSSNIEEIIKKSDIIIFGVPAAFLHSSISKLNPKLLEDKIIISAIKGIVPEYNETISEYFKSKFNIPFENFGLIAGPCHAEEVIMEKLSYLTIASVNNDLNTLLSELLTTRSTQISVSNDIKGIEFASVLKNIYAVAAGISVGLGFGDNFLSVLIINAITEMRSFLDAINHIKRDINQSSYSGDIIVTAYSQFSRNRAFGTMIGKGYSVNYSKIEMKQIAEGYYAAKCMNEITDHYNVKMPILNAVYNILYNKSSPSREMKQLAKKLS